MDVSIRPEQRPEIARRGAAGLRLLVVLFALAALAALLARVLEKSEPRAKALDLEGPAPTTQVAPNTTERAAPQPRATESSPIERGRDRVPTATKATEEHPLRSFDDATRFEGSGEIRVVLSTRKGVTWPSTVVVKIAPSPYLMGQGRAVSRDLSLSNDLREAKFENLPLGGYEVFATGRGFQTNHAQVLLVRGRNSPLISLSLKPLGILQGLLLDKSGVPIEGFEITLERLADGDRVVATTDPAGSYLFPEVHDGEHALYFGYPENPLIPKELLTFHAPSMTFPARTLPVMAAVRFSVLDKFGTPMVDAHITGWGRDGGNVNLRTDSAGLATARFLPPGRYRLQAKTKDGLRGRLTFEVSAGGAQQVEQILVR